MRRTNRLLAIATVAGLLLAGCGGGGGGDAAISIPFTSVARGSAPDAVPHREIVVRSNAEFAALLGTIQVNGASLPATDLAVVDVLGVVLGSRPNGCYSVAVTAVTQSSSARLVRYHETAPAPGAACTQTTVNPYDLVAVPHSALPVAFTAE